MKHINEFMGYCVCDSCHPGKGWANPGRYHHVRAKKAERAQFGRAIARASKRSGHYNLGHVYYA